jgi:hypothetical protein
MERETFQWKMWQERCSSGKRGKRDVLVENVAIATYIFTNVARETFQWKTWQERRSSGKRGKSDVNMARDTLTWQERCQRGKTDVIGQHDFFFFFKFPLFCDNMDNFVHSAANKMSKFLQYILVSDGLKINFSEWGT